MSSQAHCSYLLTITWARPLFDWRAGCAPRTQRQQGAGRLQFRGWRDRGTLKVPLGVFVFLTDVLDDVPVKQVRAECHREWLGVGSGIVDCDCVYQRSVLWTRVALDRVQFFSVGVPAEIEPEPVIEPDRIDYQRVPLPTADRMSVPGRIRILWMGAPIQKDLPVAVNVAFEQNV